MLKRLLVGAAFAVLGCFGSPGLLIPQTNSIAQSKSQPLIATCLTTRNDGRLATLQRILLEFRNKSKFPGAIAGVYFADGSSLAVAVGDANRDAKTPMRKTDLLHAGSAGKTLFAALILQLVAERRLALDDPVKQYLGKDAWFARLPNSQTMTIRMLLNHTSGLPPYGREFMDDLVKFPGKEHSPLDAVKSVMDAKPTNAAGEKFAYTDVNYILLAFVAERVTGKSAYDEIKRRLLRPLGLRRIVPADSAMIPGLAPGYAGASNPFGGDQMMKDGRLVLDPRFEWGGGGFVTNAEDLARWIAAFCLGRAFDARLLPEVFKMVDAPELGRGAQSGLGIESYKSPLGQAYGHGGFFPGYVTAVRWYEKQRMAVALQLNTSDDALIGRPPGEVLDEIVAALSR